MSRRIMGSASFFELQDHTGRIQVYIRRDDICPEGDPTLYNTVFKKLLDIGDFVGVEGLRISSPSTGELSVHCREADRAGQIACGPLPVVKEKDGQGLRCLHRPRHRVTASATWTLMVNPAGTGGFRQAGRRSSPRCAVYLRRARVRGGRDPHSAAYSGRCGGTSVHYPPQRARHRPIPAHRQRALPQEADRRRLRRRV